ncbi:MAG: hypothetical protein ACRCSL_11880 [Microbacterium sp.]
MSDLWNAIPAQIRTIINVALSALIVWVGTDGLDILGSSDLDPVWKGLLIAVVTAVVRALNPVDGVYGLGSDEG